MNKSLQCMMQGAVPPVTPPSWKTKNPPYMYGGIEHKKITLRAEHLLRSATFINQVSTL